MKLFEKRILPVISTGCNRNGRESTSTMNPLEIPASVLLSKGLKSVRTKASMFKRPSKYTHVRENDYPSIFLVNIKS